MLIADDESVARVRLRRFLEDQADVEVAGEAKSGVEAMELASGARFELLVLDTEMPDCGGLDVAASLRDPRPHMVFCVQYEQAVVQEFERNGVDYLLKPVNRAQLGHALDAMRYYSSGAVAKRGVPIPPERFLARRGQSYVVTPESRVLYFESAGERASVASETGQYEMEPGLDELEQRVRASVFFRISETALVNLNGVEDVNPVGSGSGEAVMKNGRRLEVDRRRFQDFLKALAAS